MSDTAYLSAQLEVVIRKYADAPPPAEVPKWVLPPRSCEFLCSLVELLPAPVYAFEFGSGKSTHVLRAVCAGVTSIEDSAQWLNKTESSENAILRREADLSAVVPLTTCWDARRPFKSFDLGRHPQVVEQLSKSQLVLVDSPPNPATREHALVQSLHYAPADAIIVVDDLDVGTAKRFCQRLARLNRDQFSFWILPIDHELGIFLKRSLRTTRPESKPTLKEIAGQWLRFRAASAPVSN